jgi:O-antigen/teichoic acid export membrane protein
MFDNVRRVSRQLFAYGTADVMVLAVNFLLLPLYTRVLSPHEYGGVALLLLCEAFLKVVNRWGLDASYLRLCYDYPNDEDRKTLAGTVAGFLAAADGVIAVALVAAAAPINRALFGSLEFMTAYRLLVLNNFAGGFLFIPLTVLRIQERSRVFATVTFLRAFGTVLLRVILVLGLRYGVVGLVLADVIVTAATLIGLASTARAVVAWRFSSKMLRDLLAYGLPHVPHGLLSQVMTMADRVVLGFYLPLSDVGIYLIGATVASVIKFYPVAFEAAWMPFAFDSRGRRDAPKLFARMGTYAFAVLAFLVVALVGLAPPIIELMLPGDYRAAMPLIPLLTVGMAVQSLSWFPMTSVNIAKRTGIFPIVTAIGAAASLIANLQLIPRFGLRGAGIALVASQLVTTATTVYFAQHAYRIPYEVGRLSKVLVASALTVVAMTMSTAASAWSTVGLRAALVLLFPLGLLVLRFFEPHEWADLRKIVSTYTGPAVPTDR